jgi:hypothetical protein
MLCCCQVEAKRPISLSRAPGMGRASGATGYRFSAVAGFAVLGKAGKGGHAMTNRRMGRRQSLLRGAIGAGMLAFPGAAVLGKAPAVADPSFAKVPRFTVALPIPVKARPVGPNTYHITQRQTQQTLPRGWVRRRSGATTTVGTVRSTRALRSRYGEGSPPQSTTKTGS